MNPRLLAPDDIRFSVAPMMDWTDLGDFPSASLRSAESMLYGML